MRQTPTEHSVSVRRLGWVHRYSFVVLLLFVLLETLGLRWNFLWKIQELDLFVFSRSYVHDTFLHAGGCTRYLGSFLTQFFFHPWQGCLMYVVLLALASWLTAAAFNLKKHLRPYSCIPALGVLLTLTELGYEVVDLNIQGYAFVVPIGLTALVSGFLWYRKLSNGQARSGFIFGWTLLAFPLFGAYALMGTVLMVVYTLRTWNRHQDWWAWISLMVGLASVAMIPLLVDNLLFQRDVNSPYMALLPAFPAKKAYLWLPYILMGVTLLVMALAFPLQAIKKASPFQQLSSLFLCGATLLMVHLCGFNDKTFRTELNMERAFSSDNWQEALRLSDQAENHTSTPASSYTKLARYKLGLMDMPTTVSASPLSGAMIYFEYGDAESSQRWCMKQAALHGMDVYELKYLTLAARSSGNYALAAKFNKPLKGTLFYRAWALEQESLIERSVKSTTLP